MRQSAATPEQAAAISAAIEQFLRDTAPPPAPVESSVSGWLRAGLFEARQLDWAAPTPWGDPDPWGR